MLAAAVSLALLAVGAAADTTVEAAFAAGKAGAKECGKLRLLREVMSLKRELLLLSGRSKFAQQTREVVTGCACPKLCLRQIVAVLVAV